LSYLIAFNFLIFFPLNFTTFYKNFIDFYKTLLFNFTISGEVIKILSEISEIFSDVTVFAHNFFIFKKIMKIINYTNIVRNFWETKLSFVKVSKYTSLAHNFLYKEKMTFKK